MVNVSMEKTELRQLLLKLFSRASVVLQHAEFIQIVLMASPGLGLVLEDEPFELS